MEGEGGKSVDMMIDIILEFRQTLKTNSNESRATKTVHLRRGEKLLRDKLYRHRSQMLLRISFSFSTSQ